MKRTYTLYTFFGSSCTARVRIAAHLKGIPLEYKFIRLHKGDQFGEEYVDIINPSACVPALIVHEDGKDVATITQSVAIIEYLDETVDGEVKLLLPASEPLMRAKVRELTNVVVCDIQPLTNMRVFKHVESLAQEGKYTEDDWQRHWMALGLKAYEKLVRESTGKYSVGDCPTMADVCLVAAVDRAVRYNVDMSQFPCIERIDKEIRELDAYKKGNFRSQPDTFRSVREVSEVRL